MDIVNSKDMRTVTLQVRKKVSKVDDEELIHRIKENASDGEFELQFVRNRAEEYPTISAETIKGLQQRGYKVRVWYKKGWDNLHRFYKGALTVTWYK